MSLISKRTIKEQIYAELKRRILLHEYQPGERLNIDCLAREMEVSNSPLREALIMLEKDELVYTLPNSGPRVIELDEARTVEIDQSVYVLLTGAYNLCLRMGRREHLVQILETRLEAQEQLIGESDSMKILLAAIAFDRGFLDACGNERLGAIYSRLADIFFLSVMKRNRDAVEIAENIEEHKDILRAARNYNESEVERLIAKHYRQPLI